jgi:hypothetical protein
MTQTSERKRELVEELKRKREKLAGKIRIIEDVLLNGGHKLPRLGLYSDNILWSSAEQTTDTQNRIDILNDDHSHPRRKYREIFGPYGDRESFYSNGIYNRTLTKTQYEEYLSRIIEDAEKGLKAHPEKAPEGRCPIANKVFREGALERLKFARTLLNEHNLTPYSKSMRLLLIL